MGPGTMPGGAQGGFHPPGAPGSGFFEQVPAGMHHPQQQQQLYQQGFPPHMQGPGASGSWGGPAGGPPAQGFMGGPGGPSGYLPNAPMPFGGAGTAQFATPARAPPARSDEDDFGDFGTATPAPATPMPRAPPPTPAGPVPHGVTKGQALDDDLFAVRNGPVHTSVPVD